MRILTLAILSLPSVGLAYSSRCPTTVAYFANGMFNEYADAIASLKALKNKVRRHDPIHFNQIARWQVAYNTNEPVLMQLWQVFDQKRAETAGNFWSAIFRLMEKSQDARTSINEILARLSREQSFKDVDLRKQMRSYMRDIRSGFFIITIAHSQGNLYSLFAFDRLRPWSEQMDLYSVATPANRTFESDAYVTLWSDGVIKAVPFALPPNATKRNAGLFDHNFIADYLTSSQAREAILTAFDSSREIQWKYDLLAQGNLDISLEPVLNLLRDRIYDRKSLRAEECFIYLSISVLNEVFGPFGDNECSTVEFKDVLKVVDDCIWDLEAHDTFGACPFGGSLSMQLNPGVSAQRSERLLKSNPWCNWNTMDDLKKQLGVEGARRARAILMAPPDH